MQDIKQRAALSSIGASAGLTIAKAVIGLATGSLAILSEAAHSLLDLAATIMTYFAVRVSGRPADAEHHYGHGKVESVTALAETALLFLLSGMVIWEAGHRLIGGESHAVAATMWAFGVIVVSIVVDFFRARVLYRVAKETASEALEADALHFGSDMWSSAAVLIGLAAVLMGFPWADSAAAIVVALFICVAGWRLGRRTIDTLTDTAPAGAGERIKQIATRVAGVVAIDRVRVRPAGHTLFVDLDVAVSRTLALDRVTAIKDRIVTAVRGEFPTAETTVNSEPRALDDETVLERVMVIARNRALAVHHVTVQAIAGRLSVSLDLEVDGSLAFSRAHEIADGLEQAVRDELGLEVEVETHVEPLQTRGLFGRDAADERIRAVHGELSSIAQRLGVIRDVHDVRVRETPDGEIVNFHAYVDPLLSVSEVHDRIDDLERGLRLRFPAIKRVIGHAEPRRG
jgi:cation diffusion facilitator family transporter